MNLTTNQTLHNPWNQTASFNGTQDYCLFNPYDPLCWLDDESDKPFKLTTGAIVAASFMSLLIIVSLGGNILLCTAFFFYRRLRKTTNYFIISLAVSDILVASISMPIWISFQVTGWRRLPHWIHFHKLYKFWTWFDILSGTSSITNLTAISIDRFFSIMAPLLHRTRMTSSIAVLMIALAWLYGIVVASFSYVKFDHFTLVASGVGFFLPLVVIIIAYIAIYCKVKHGFLSKRSEKDWNLERTLVIVICVFVICWMPFFLFSILYHYCEVCPIQAHTIPYIMSVVKWMHYLNSGLNPFIYGFFNTNFKMAFRALLKQCFSGATIDSDFSNRLAEAHDSTLVNQIRSFGRKLRFSRGSNKSNGHTENESMCVTMVSTLSPSNRNSNVLNNNACDSPLIGGNEETEGPLMAAKVQQNGMPKTTDNKTVNGIDYRKLSATSQQESVCNADLTENCHTSTDSNTVNESDKPKIYNVTQVQFLNAQESCV